MALTNTEKEVSSLVINKVPTNEIYQQMVEQNLINEDELYLVQDDDKLKVDGILKGDGSGNVSAAVANTDYATCTNLRNGSAEGSLRTVGASPESSSYTMGENAFAEGKTTSASGSSSHAEGYATIASESSSHAEGAITTASGKTSHAEGSNTEASGYSSHAEGDGTTASGKNSHAEGFNTEASHKSQHTQGEYNIYDDSTAAATDRGNYAHIVGNGTSFSKRSNAHTLDWSGNAWFAGDVYVGSTSGTNKDDGSKKLITADDIVDSAVIAIYGQSTFSDITAAVNNGRVVVLNEDNEFFYALSAIDNSNIYFTAMIQDRYNVKVQLSSSNVYSKIVGTVVLDTRTINNKPLSSNITLGKTYNITLNPSEWEEGSLYTTQTISVSGLVATYNAAPTIDLALDQVAGSTDAEKKTNIENVIAAWGMISSSLQAETATGSITFKYLTKESPTVDIPIRITTYD